jgi:hypothetical protein
MTAFTSIRPIVILTVGASRAEKDSPASSPRAAADRLGGAAPDLGGTNAECAELSGAASASA